VCIDHSVEPTDGEVCWESEV